MAEGQKSSSGWLKGCAIGCGVVVLLAAAGGVGAFFWVKGKMGEAVVEIQAETLRQYTTATQEIELTPEQREVLDALLAYSQQEGMSFSGVVVSATVLSAILEDKAVDEEELTIASDTVAFFEANPIPGLAEMSMWMQSHPELQQRAQQYQSRGNGGNAETPPLVEVVEEAPEAPEPEEAAPVQ